MKKTIVIFFVSIIGFSTIKAQVNQNKVYHITLPGNYWSYIIDKLTALPMKEVYPLVNSISNQIDMQNKPDTVESLKPTTDSTKSKNNKSKK